MQNPGLILALPNHKSFHSTAQNNLNYSLIHWTCDIFHFWEVKVTFLIFVRCWCKIDLCFRSFLDCENMTHIHESHIDILLSFFLVQLVCIIKWNFRPVSVKKWSMLYNRSVVTDCTFDKRFCQWAHFWLLLEINDELSIWTSLSKWSKLGNFTTMTKIGP